MRKKKNPKSQKKLARAAFKIIAEYPWFKIGELNASEIARRLGVSLPNLSRAYNNYYNISLLHQLQKKKYLSFFKLIALYGVESVKEALEILDIRSASHFIKQYKKQINVTPGIQFRRWKKIRESVRGPGGNFPHTKPWEID